MPKILVIDEDLHRSLKEVFEKLGYQVKDVRDFSLSGASDDEVFNFTKKNKAILISGDLGFANILRFPPKSHYGIIILRFPNEMPTSMINKIVYSFLKDIPFSKLKNSLTIVSHAGVKIRK